MSAPSTPRRLTPLNGSSRRSEPPRVAGRNLSGSRAGSSRDLQAEELRAAIVPPIISARNALAGLHTIEFPDSDINDEFTNDDGGSQQDSGKGPGNQGMHGATTETPLEVVRHAIRARKVASRKKMPRPGLAAGARRARNNAATPTQSSAKASSSSRSRPGSAQFSRRQARPTTLEAGETSPSDRRRVLRSRDLDSAGGMRQRPSTAPALRNNVTAVANTPVEQQEPPPGAHDKGIRAFERMISPGERHKITTVGFERPRSFVELQSQRSPLHRPGHGHRMHSQELEQYHDLPQASGGQRRGFGGGNSSNLSDDEFDDFHLVVARPNSIPYASNSPGAHPDVTSPAWEESEKLPMDFGPPPPQRVVYASNIDPWDARCQRAVSRKDQIRSDKVRHIEELLDYKMNRQARWDEKRRVEHGQKMLLASVYFSARQHIFKVGLRMGRINSHKKRKFVMQRKAAVIIQRWYGRRRMAKRLKDSERQMAALQRFIIRWQNMYRLSRKNASQEVLSKWLQEAFTQGFVIRAFMKFTRRIYLIQKFTIAFIVCRRARLELLELALQKVEAERMQDLDAMKKVNELAALEHMAYVGVFFFFSLFCFASFYFFLLTLQNALLLSISPAGTLATPSLRF